MNKHFIKLIWKISLITFVLVFVIGIGSSFVWSIFANNDDTKNVPKTNANSFQNMSNPVLWKAGVALSLNIGTRYTQMNELPVNLYSDVITVAQLMSSWSINDSWMISTNMALITEYKNVLNTDVKWLLSNSIDREQMLSSIVAQFQYRYNLATDQMKLLLVQQKSFDAEMKTKENSISWIKSKLQQDFSKSDAQSTYEDIEKYTQLQKEFIFARTYLVLVNQFLNDYAVLNEQNKKILDVLTTNKDAIIKNSYVVIPDWWTDLLRDFNLLYDKWETIKKQSN